MPAAALNLAPGTPGCFGKLPQRGDFLRRGLEAAVVEAWDDWIARGLSASRDAIGSDWTELYLTAPVWAFVLGAGASVTGAAQAGILCPSADRVGRCYPVAVVAPLAGPGDPDRRAAGDWFAEAEEAAVAVVEERLDPETFFARVARLGLPGFGAEARDLRLDGAGAPPEALAPAIAAGGAGLWWTEGSEIVEPATLLCPRGMPDPARFAALLDGSWAEHGWDVPARDPLEAAT